jgi:hypothetical protein
MQISREVKAELECNCLRKSLVVPRVSGRRW